MSNEVKNIIVYRDDITEQKRDQMNCLYRTCVYVLRDYYDFVDHGTWFNLQQLQNQLNVLHQLLIKINKDSDPVGHVSSTSAMAETAAMLAR